METFGQYFTHDYTEFTMSSYYVLIKTKFIYNLVLQAIKTNKLMNFLFKNLQVSSTHNSNETRLVSKYNMNIKME